MLFAMDFYSNGKLMISGEYFALFGAMVLAVPLRLGQSMKVQPSDGNQKALTWIAKAKGKEWFREEFFDAGFHYNGPKTGQSDYLQALLLAAGNLNPSFANQAMHAMVVTNTGFPQEWGLGSSSALISNLASWAGVDPYKLHFLTSNGSGYDIACARSQMPISYKYNGKEMAPFVQPVSFNPPFAGNLWFVYSGKKQSSAQSIGMIRHEAFSQKQAGRITDISLKMISESSLDMFMKLMRLHEQIVSEAIDMCPVQQERFDDFPGVVKSLGAWGGDFVLAATHLDELLVKQYFYNKGCAVVLNFRELAI